jgi:hypothetical protein
MDADRFDRFARSLAVPGTRRRLVRVLAALPLGVTLTTLLGDGPEATAADDDHGSSHRRQRRRARNRHRPGNDKGKGKNKDQGKKPCAAVGQKPRTRKRRGCCQGLAKDATGRCAAAATPTPPSLTPTCLPPTPTSPTQGLQEAINQAAPGAILTLCPGTWHLSATVVIAKNLTLRGAGAGQSILDGGNAVRVLQIGVGTTVTVQNLTITKGRVSGDFPDNAGGGIRSLGMLTLEGVTVTGNSATAFGGGMVIRGGGTLTLRNGSRVSGNTAIFFGGGIDNGASTVILEAGSLVGGDTPADANSTSVEGGGIYNFQGGTVTLQDGSRVAGNSATDEGGGIYNASTVILATNALVCDNTQGVGNQCGGPAPVTGQCPNPSDGNCPP